MTYINVSKFRRVRHNRLNCVRVYDERMGVLGAEVGAEVGVVVKMVLRIWEPSMVVRTGVCVSGVGQINGEMCLLSFQRAF